MYNKTKGKGFSKSTARWPEAAAGFRNRYRPRKDAPVYVWKPCIPSWEKEFTRKVGNMSWEDFVESKKYISLYDNVMQWNDSACEEAFHIAKKIFWDRFNCRTPELSLPDWDTYEEMNSAPDQENPEDHEDLLLSISDRDEETSSETDVMPPVIRLEDIKPTGWDVDDPNPEELLVGLVVGDHSDDEDNGRVLQDSLNINRPPDLKYFRRIM